MTDEDRAQLLKFMRLLASDQMGERAAAALKANQLAEKLGGWDKVFSPVQVIPPEVLKWAAYGQQVYAEQQRVRMMQQSALQNAFMNQNYGQNFAQGYAQQQAAPSATIAVEDTWAWPVQGKTNAGP